MHKLSLAKEREVGALLTRKGRQILRKLVVEGSRTISTMLESGVTPEYLVVSTAHLTSTGREMYRRLSSASFPIYECSARQLTKLTETEQAQGLLGVVSQESLPKPAERWENPRFLIYLDEIADPGNLGTIIRTAAAFSADSIVLSSQSAEISNPKTIRASAGMIFKIPLLRIAEPETFFARLKSNNFELLAGAADGAIELADIVSAGKICLAIGSEARGLSDETKKNARTTFRIGTAPGVESLNASAAAAIAIHHFARKMGLI